jgi:hypothetical protein
VESAFGSKYTAKRDGGATPGGESTRGQALWLWDSLGWTVVAAYFPCRIGGLEGCSCRLGAKCDKPGKHPVGEWGEFEHDKRTRARWWHADEHANASLLTGRRSGVVVGDVDPRHGGRLATLWERGWSRETVVARTGGGGYHVYAECPPGGLASVDAYAEGIELKADGKQVIIPPSLHIDHRRYRWVAGHSPRQIGVARLPDAVLTGLRAPRTSGLRAPREPILLSGEQRRELARRVPGLVARAVARALAGKDGGRHNTGVWLACQLRDRRVSDEVGRWALLAYQQELEA